MLPGSSKLIKKHVLETERKDQLLELVRISQKERKNLWKETRAFTKELHGLYSTRDSKKDDFNALFTDYALIRKNSQEANLKLALKSQELITEEEWQNMRIDFTQEMAKLDNNLRKDIKAVKKHFEKLEISVNKHVSEEKNAEAIIEQIQDIETTTINLLEAYKREIHNENSILYQYQVDQNKLEEWQSDHADNINKLLNDYRDLYFIAVENTNDKEWNKIRNKFKLPI